MTMTHSSIDRLDSITIHDLRQCDSLKWSRYPDKIGAFVAEMDFGTSPSITRELRYAMSKAMLGYASPNLSNRLAISVAEFQRSRYGWDVSESDIYPVPDILSALTIVLNEFTAAESKVVVPTPAYMPFLQLAGLHGREVVEVPLIRDGSRWVYDLDALSVAFRSGGDVLILCNPHNPTGTMHTREELAEIGELVGSHGVRVFADEVHAPLAFTEQEHVPFASVDATTADQTITLTSASKAWNIAGLKCAQAIVTSDRDRAKWRLHGGDWANATSTLGMVANIAAYRDTSGWLSDILSYLDRNRCRLTALIEEYIHGARYTPPMGTFLSWVEMPGYSFDSPLASLLFEHGIVVTDGRRCGVPSGSAIRYNFATPMPIMEYTWERIGRIVG